MSIKVQTEVFSFDELTRDLHAEDNSVGAVATFVGYVRNINQGKNVSSLFLEHYPGMTERSLQLIVDQANKRRPLQRVTIVYRVVFLVLVNPLYLSESPASIGMPPSMHVPFNGCSKNTRTFLEA